MESDPEHVYVKNDWDYVMNGANLANASVAIATTKEDGSALEVKVPVKRTGGIVPVIKSVLDNVTGIYDVIGGVNAFTIAGTDLGPDTSKDDEYVGVISSNGTLVKAEIVSSDLNTVKAAFGSALEAGEYTLVVATRSGLGDEFAVKTATRKVRIG